MADVAARRVGRSVAVAIAGPLLLIAPACSGGEEGGLPAGGDETVLDEGTSATARAGDATAMVRATAADLEVTADVFAPEGTYVGAEVRVCGTDADVALPWTARTADQVVEPTPLPPGALGPDHPPLDQTAGTGADGCAEGWLVWDLPAAGAVARWDGDPSSGWLLPAG